MKVLTVLICIFASSASTFLKPTPCLKFTPIFPELHCLHRPMSLYHTPSISGLSTSSIFTPTTKDSTF